MAQTIPVAIYTYAHIMLSPSSYPIIYYLPIYPLSIYCLSSIHLYIHHPPLSLESVYPTSICIHASESGCMRAHTGVWHLDPCSSLPGRFSHHLVGDTDRIGGLPAGPVLLPTRAHLGSDDFSAPSCVWPAPRLTAVRTALLSPHRSPTIHSPSMERGAGSRTI